MASAEMSGPSVTVTVTHNNEKHNIQVVAQQGNNEPSLQDMALLIEQVTGVPLAFQKLIYKGKSLKEMEQPLSTLGVKNGCRVMLIGKKNSPEEEAELKKLRDLEKSVEKIADQLVGVNEELVGIQKTLPETFRDCRLKRKGLVKKVQVCSLMPDVTSLIPFLYNGPPNADFLQRILTGCQPQPPHRPANLRLNALQSVNALFQLRCSE
ncbi:BAG family molecular chaperone regulator 1 isoform X3 [Vombatus ursinus]|uniref:BAG family molecular chaperone regulator 1 isoform X3 n=1 Tax=Vombatus ursinus TaxID=29139 RepID=UPI000FFD2E39|nr:BAG family molecular chaperone regulator 1 isoform X3 [Vombatus ursinus]